jgi:hypothetical protein
VCSFVRKFGCEVADVGTNRDGNMVIVPSTCCSLGFIIFSKSGCRVRLVRSCGCIAFSSGRHSSGCCNVTRSACTPSHKLPVMAPSRRQWQRMSFKRRWEVLGNCFRQLMSVYLLRCQCGRWKEKQWLIKWEEDSNLLKLTRNKIEHQITAVELNDYETQKSHLCENNSHEHS